MLGIPPSESQWRAGEQPAYDSRAYPRHDAFIDLTDPDGQNHLRLVEEFFSITDPDDNTQEIFWGRTMASTPFVSPTGVSGFVIGDMGMVEDAIGFVAREVLPTFGSIRPVVDTLAVHPTCSSTQMGLNPALETIARSVATNVVVPDSWGCCAFAGDRGMLHPELTASATAMQAAEVASLGADAHASCRSRLSRALPLQKSPGAGAHLPGRSGGGHDGFDARDVGR